MTSIKTLIQWYIITVEIIYRLILYIHIQGPTKYMVGRARNSPRINQLLLPVPSTLFARRNCDNEKEKWHFKISILINRTFINWLSWSHVIKNLSQVLRISSWLAVTNRICFSFMKSVYYLSRYRILKNQIF